MTVPGSQDNTSNAPIGGDPFSDLKSALADNVADPELRARLLTAIDDMRAWQGQAQFADAYQKFVGLSAGHVEMVGPYLARFAQMIG